MATQSDDDFDKDLDAADAVVSAQFCAKLTLSSDHLKSICPSPVDRAALDKLMQAVNGAANENEAKRQLVANAESYAAIIVRLVKTVAIA